MKKAVAILIIFIVSSCIFSICAYGIDIEEYESDIYSTVPEDVDVKDGFVLSNILDYIIKNIKNYISYPKKIITSSLLYLFLSSLLTRFENIINNARLKRIFSFSVMLCISVNIISSLDLTVDAAESFLNKIVNYINIIEPTVISISLLGGNVSSASISSNGFLIFILVCENIYLRLLLPIIKLVAVISISSSITEQVPDMSGVVKFLKNIFQTVLSFIMMLYCTFLTSQRFISSGTDNLLTKSVKFTLSSSVPFVGVSLGEAMRSVSASAKYLKSTFGGVAIIVILLFILPPIIKIIINKLLYSMLFAISKMLNLNVESKIFECMEECSKMILALILSAGFMFVFSLMLFVNISDGGV